MNQHVISYATKEELELLLDGEKILLKEYRLRRSQLLSELDRYERLIKMIEVESAVATRALQALESESCPTTEKAGDE
jgi:hypothetical protein